MDTVDLIPLIFRFQLQADPYHSRLQALVYHARQISLQFVATFKS
jgi:hypothetical protein